MSWRERKDEFIHIYSSIDKKTGESTRPKKTWLQKNAIVHEMFLNLYGLKDQILKCRI